MIAQRIDAVAEKIEAKERMFYSSVAYLQFSDDTGQFDELKEKGDYEGLLALGREYYDGNGINEKYTYLSPLQNKGDDLLIEDKDFAVVYNGSVGGTYEVMLKFTEQEIRDHIKQYGVDIAGETIKEVARDMVAEQFDRLPRSPVLEWPVGIFCIWSITVRKIALRSAQLLMQDWRFSTALPTTITKTLTTTCKMCRPPLKPIPNINTGGMLRKKG